MGVRIALRRLPAPLGSARSWGLVAGAAGILAASGALAPGAPLHEVALALAPPCPLRWLTGLPCPFCGLTTGTGLALRGELALGWRSHCLSPAVAAAGVGVALYASVVRLGAGLALEVQWDARTRRLARLALAGAVVAAWAASLVRS